jgi:NAD(P)-dependent dehydrogenase (short-subunit alcohol dehydrogenase family)
MDLNGKSVLVAGGASGLGRSAAEAFLENGARVVVLDLAEGAATTEHSGRLQHVVADARDSDQVSAAVDLASADGGLWACLNCVGIAPAGRTVGRNGALDLEEFRRVIEINLIGTFNVCRLAAMAMSANEPDDGERGVIVNTASVAAFDGQIGQAAYAASKSGVVGLTLPVARDLASMQIRCVTIAPGLFDTPMLATISAEQRRLLEDSVPHPSRLGRPAEYAALVLHIVKNQMLNGEVIRLDGAVRMAPR